MVEPLRPLSTRELLASTFSLYRRHFKLFFLASAVAPVATFVCRLCYVAWTLAAAHPEPGSATVLMAVEIAAGIMIMLLAGMALSSAATVKAVENIYLGREVGVANAYRAFKGRFWRIIAIVLSVFIRAFLSGVLFIGLGMFALGLAAALGYNSRVEAGTIGLVCGCIALVSAIFAAARIYVRYAVAVQACVTEDISTKAALERSVFLTQGDHIRVTTVYSVFIILSLVVGIVLETSTLLLRGQEIAFRISVVIANLIATSLAVPVGTIAMAFMYFDERIRKEAFDRQAVTDSSLEPLRAVGPFRRDL